jgi:hypothetical protein
MNRRSVRRNCSGCSTWGMCPASAMNVSCDSSPKVRRSRLAAAALLPNNRSFSPHSSRIGTCGRGYVSPSPRTASRTRSSCGGEGWVRVSTSWCGARPGSANARLRVDRLYAFHRNTAVMSCRMGVIAKRRRTGAGRLGAGPPLTSTNPSDRVGNCDANCHATAAPKEFPTTHALWIPTAFRSRSSQRAYSPNVRGPCWAGSARPGRSGATTLNRSVSRVHTGAQCISAPPQAPWIRSTAVPLPPCHTMTGPPSISMLVEVTTCCLASLACVRLVIPTIHFRVPTVISLLVHTHNEIGGGRLELSLVGQARIFDA